MVNSMDQAEQPPREWEGVDAKHRGEGPPLYRRSERSEGGGAD